MTLEHYKKYFQNYLDEEKKRLTQKSQQLRLENRDDEYKFAQVELNIVEIFSQMFDLSCKKAASEQNWQIILKETYLTFFDKIPQAWQANLKKCIQFGLDDDVLIETLKLEKADSIKSTFMTMLNESV